MNWNLFLIYVAIGAFSEIFTIRRFTPGQRMASGIQILAGGFVVSAFVPPSANSYVGFGLFVAGLGRVLGQYLSNGIDRVRVWRDGRDGRLHNGDAIKR